MKLPFHIHIASGWAVAIATPSAVEAQPNTMNIMPRTSRVGETNRPSSPPNQAQLESSYTAAGRAKFLGTKSGDSDAFNAPLHMFAPLPLSARWIMSRWGWARRTCSSTPSA